MNTTAKQIVIIFKTHRIHTCLSAIDAFSMPSSSPSLPSIPSRPSPWAASHSASALSSSVIGCVALRPPLPPSLLCPRGVACEEAGGASMKEGGVMPPSSVESSVEPERSSELRLDEKNYNNKLQVNLHYSLFFWNCFLLVKILVFS